MHNIIKNKLYNFLEIIRGLYIKLYKYNINIIYIVYLFNANNGKHILCFILCIILS